MIRSLLSACCVLVLVGVAPAADEPPARIKKLLGTWQREAGVATVTFRFHADRLEARIEAGDATIDVTADYGVTKDGTVFAIVTNVEKKGTGDGPSVGDLFAFHLATDKDKATLKDLKGTDGEDAKRLVQGEYKRLAEKK